MADSKPDELEQIVEEVVDRVRRRLGAARVGVEEPCTPSSPTSTQAAASDATPDCKPSCGECPIEGSCASRQAVLMGSGRISPDVVRTSKDIAPYIDHTLLNPDATREQVEKLCDEARRYGFATVCLNASYIPLASRLLAGSSTVPIAVVGFPLGATVSAAKAFEAREAIRAGAREIDMVINIGALKSRDYRLVASDIVTVVKASSPAPVKVILETSKLNEDEKIVACALAKASGAAFVKTSTGFGGGGATAADVALMRRIVGDDMGVKASGGVRTTDDAKKMLAAGASRIGASASIAIVTGEKAAPAKY
jgi:deoxyribose-phosphate aldolase